VTGLPSVEERRAFWLARGADEGQADELLAYASNPVQSGPWPRYERPANDAPCVQAWDGYAQAAGQQGVFETLRQNLIQLRFPIRAGISEDPTYQMATRRGWLPDDTEARLALRHPERLRLFVHDTAAGRIPVLVADDRADFEDLVRALTKRNEPAPVPSSMGACTIAGYNNWGRVAALRATWQARTPAGTEDDWNETFRGLMPQKELYQDRFMLLSTGPYSATPASVPGLADQAWREASLRLRLEHECTHYFMRQVCGAMRKSLLDELVADYMGLVHALGGFRLDCFLHFMGLEAFPPYREGGRLQNYRGQPPLSDGAFALLPAVLLEAARQLARLDPLRGQPEPSAASKARVVIALTRVGLEGLAGAQAAQWLGQTLAEAPATA
jgi:hypothetical protein